MKGSTSFVGRLVLSYSIADVDDESVVGFDIQRTARIGNVRGRSKHRRSALWLRRTDIVSKARTRLCATRFTILFRKTH